MSLNLKAIINSKKIYLHIEGDEKFEVLQDALKSNDSFKTPVSAVLNSNNIVEVFYS
jgi:6-phosphogluconolactonase/glucosamine-6-phosphate isomerase/deaminase